jgi:hypothetical protein
VVLDGRRAETERCRHLGDRHATEVAQLNDASLPLVESGELLQRVMKIRDVRSSGAPDARAGINAAAPCP